jgi:hypothetical protein
MRYYDSLCHAALYSGGNATGVESLPASTSRVGGPELVRVEANASGLTTLVAVALEEDWCRI